MNSPQSSGWAGLMGLRNINSDAALQKIEELSGENGNIMYLDNDPNDLGGDTDEIQNLSDADLLKRITG